MEHLERLLTATPLAQHGLVGVDIGVRTFSDFFIKDTPRTELEQYATRTLNPYRLIVADLLMGVNTKPVTGISLSTMLSQLSRSIRDGNRIKQDDVPQTVYSVAPQAMIAAEIYRTLRSTNSPPTDRAQNIADLKALVCLDLLREDNNVLQIISKVKDRRPTQILERALAVVQRFPPCAPAHFFDELPLLQMASTTATIGKKTPSAYASEQTARPSPQTIIPSPKANPSPVVLPSNISSPFFPSILPSIQILPDSVLSRSPPNPSYAQISAASTHPARPTIEKSFKYVSPSLALKKIIPGALAALLLGAASIGVLGATYTAYFSSSSEKPATLRKQNDANSSSVSQKNAQEKYETMLAGNDIMALVREHQALQADKNSAHFKQYDSRFDQRLRLAARERFNDYARQLQDLERGGYSKADGAAKARVLRQRIEQDRELLKRYLP